MDQESRLDGSPAQHRNSAERAGEGIVALRR